MLTYIHSIFINREKSCVQEKTLQAFDLEALRKAHKDLFTYLQPKDKYGYNGPRASDREKAVHAFDQIYKKMKNSDAVKDVIFACQSRDLRMLPPMSSDNHAPCMEQINQLHSNMQQQIDELK